MQFSVTGSMASSRGDSGPLIGTSSDGFGCLPRGSTSRNVSTRLSPSASQFALSGTHIKLFARTCVYACRCCVGSGYLLPFPFPFLFCFCISLCSYAGLSNRVTERSSAVRGCRAALSHRVQTVFCLSSCCTLLFSLFSHIHLTADFRLFDALLFIIRAFSSWFCLFFPT